jgi:ornithine cyclodeaminase/alanine dehydrogenase-like protein (mu-crystallin family)
VVDPDAIGAGTHVTTIGPKFAGRHELPLPVAGRAAIIASDSLAQVDSYPEPFMLAGTRDRDRMVELGALAAGRVRWARHPGDVSLFVSVGLAGTEPYLAAAVLDAADRD